MILTTAYRDHCIALCPLIDKLFGNIYVFDYTTTDNTDFPTIDGSEYQTSGWWNPSMIATISSDKKEVYISRYEYVGDGYMYSSIWKLEFNPVFWDWFMETIWHLYEEDLTMSLEGVEVEIESVFYDMESPTVAKKFRRAYVEIDNVAPMSGYIHFEPGYNMRRRLHTHGESATPDHSVSGGAFGSAGILDWETTPANFDDTIGNWMKHRIDLGLLGNSVRFMLKLGDVDSSLNGRIRIKTPILLHKNKGVR